MLRLAATFRVRPTPPAALLVVCALASGCGGEPTQPEPVERSEAQQQCDALMDTWCRSALDCYNEGLAPEEMLDEETLSTELQTCVDVSRITCDGALAVSDGYETCFASVEELSDGDCEALRAAIADEGEVSMPASCEGVLLSE